MLFCHGTPRSEVECFTRLTPEERVISIFEVTGASMVVCGHTHMQFDRTIGSTRVINAGSVGMPFGDPGADWLLLGRHIELRHTTYDLDAAAKRIRATGYPGAQEFASNNVLNPPSEEQMLAVFAAAELPDRQPGGNRSVGVPFRGKFLRDTERARQRPVLRRGWQREHRGDCSDAATTIVRTTSGCETSRIQPNRPPNSASTHS